MVAGVFLLAGLVYRPMLLFLLFAIAFGLFFGGGYYLIKTIKDSNTQPDYTDEVTASIEGQLQMCRNEIAKNRKEISEINNSIFDIESTLDKNESLHVQNREESKRILAGFYRELDLRKAKLEFYELCRSKLDSLLANFEFSKKLESKQAKLNELKEAHHDDIAKMEVLRSDLEYNLRYIETIEVLSLRMLESNSLDSANQLQLELKEITKELRGL